MGFSVCEFLAPVWVGGKLCRKMVLCIWAGQNRHKNGKKVTKGQKRCKKKSPNQDLLEGF